MEPIGLTSGTHPAWSADGRSIAFLSDLTNLYLMEPDGNGKVLLADKVYGAAVWQP
jgi:Tol biopolymer transport system component